LGIVANRGADCSEVTRALRAWFDWSIRDCFRCFPIVSSIVANATSWMSPAMRLNDMSIWKDFPAQNLAACRLFVPSLYNWRM
jgi:hypothetical protein